jgi:hypothetical protein
MPDMRCGFAQNGTFIIPAFGFVAVRTSQGNQGIVGLIRPTVPRYVFLGRDGKAKEIVKLGQVQIIATPVPHGKLAVIKILRFFGRNKLHSPERDN